jgi:hypothetical protein
MVRMYYVEHCSQGRICHNNWSSSSRKGIVIVRLREREISLTLSRTVSPKSKSIEAAHDNPAA